MKYDQRIVRAWFKEHGIEPVAELQFAPDRKWRFDFAWPHKKVALEVQGGLFVNGRHSRGAALMKEHEKLNRAAAMGWRVLYCVPQDLCTTDTIATVKEALDITNL